MLSRTAALRAAITMTFCCAIGAAPALADDTPAQTVTRSPGESVPRGLPVPGDDRRPPALATTAEAQQGAATAAAAPEDAAEGNAGTWHPLFPQRLLDTRYGHGASGRVGPGGTVPLQVTGRGGVPASGVSSVVLNVTAVDASTPTWVAAWPSGQPQPATSNLNLAGGGEVRANLVTVEVGADGVVNLFNAAGTAHLLADVQGYYASADGELGGGYHPVPPTRTWDSREYNFPWWGAEAWAVPVDVPGLDWRRVTAVTVNLTAVSPTSSGHLTAWDGWTEEPPVVSNVNFAPGVDTPNLATVPVFLDEFDVPHIVIYNSSGETHVVVDVLGWYDWQDRAADGYRFTPTATPSRVLDTRYGTGGPVAPLAGGSIRYAPTSAVAPGARALVANVTGVSPSAQTWLGVSPGPAVPQASTLNLRPGEDRPNLTVVGTDPSQSGFSIYNSVGSTDVVVDVFGFFS